MPAMSDVIEHAPATIEHAPATDKKASTRDAGELVRAGGGRPGALGALLEGVGGVDQVGVTERADALKKRSIKKASKVWALELIIRMTDLTTLEGKDTAGKVRALCAKGIHPDPTDHSIPSVATICVYPSLVAVAKDWRGSTTVTS